MTFSIKTLGKVALSIMLLTLMALKHNDTLSTMTLSIMTLKTKTNSPQRDPAAQEHSAEFKV